MLFAGSEQRLDRERTNYSWHDEFFETTDVPVPLGFVDFDEYEYIFAEAAVLRSNAYTSPDNQPLESRTGEATVSGILRIRTTYERAIARLDLGRGRNVNDPAPGDPTRDPTLELRLAGQISDVRFYPLGIASPWRPITAGLTDGNFAPYLITAFRGIRLGE